MEWHFQEGRLSPSPPPLPVEQGSKSSPTPLLDRRLHASCGASLHPGTSQPITVVKAQVMTHEGRGLTRSRRGHTCVTCKMAVLGGNGGPQFRLLIWPKSINELWSSLSDWPVCRKQNTRSYRRCCHEGLHRSAGNLHPTRIFPNSRLGGSNLSVPFHKSVHKCLLARVFVKGNKLK